MPVSVKVGGVWKTAAAVYNKVGGVWKAAADMPVKVAGVWKTGILAPPGAYESIATINIASTTNSVTFSSIPSTYKHLQIRYSARNVNAGINDLYVSFNGGSNGPYSKHWLFTFDGAGPYTSTSFNDAQISVGYTTGNGGSFFATGIVDIYDYQSTSKNKTISYLTGNEKPSTGTKTLIVGGGAWFNTSAINSLTMSTSDFAANSTIALYGIKG